MYGQFEPAERDIRDRGHSNFGFPAMMDYDFSVIARHERSA